MTIPPGLSTQPEGQNQAVLELIYAIRTLSQALEDMHSDLRRLMEEESRVREKDHEKIRDLIVGNSLVLQQLPVATADRLDDLVQKRVDSVLDETRRTLDDVRMKLWMYLGTPKGSNASGSHMTISEEGNPVPLPVDKEKEVTGRITLHEDGKMKVEGRFNAGKIAKVFLVLKWAIASLAAAGGVAGIVKAVLAIIHGV